MSTDRPDTAPLAAPRDIESNPTATLVRCPDCSAAVFNLRHQRQGHLKWHDDIDADVASAQDAAQHAQETAHATQQALNETRHEIAELRRSHGDTTAAPLIGEWPEDELAARATDPRTNPPEPTPDEDEDEDEDEDDAGYVDLPAFPETRI